MSVHFGDERFASSNLTYDLIVVKFSSGGSHSLGLALPKKTSFSLHCLLYSEQKQSVLIILTVKIFQGHRHLRAESNLQVAS